MKKLTTALVLLLFLVLLPFGSWYYLKSGFDYRKSALDELERKNIFSNDTDTQNYLLKRTSLIVNTSDKIAVNAIYQQFKDAPTFQIICDSLSGFNFGKNALLWNGKKNNMDNFTNCDYILIDTNGYIRCKYMKGEEYKMKLVKHIATLLPLTPKRSTEDKNSH